jgi:hypothetical protein
MADTMDEPRSSRGFRAGRHPERTLFTRFIPPQKPTDMPGMWQRYYTR